MVLFLLVKDVFITVLSAFGSSFIVIVTLFVFPLELVADISTVPACLAVISPVALTVAIFSLPDFHVMFWSVALLGIIVVVSIVLFPTSRLSIFLFICMSVTSIVAGVAVGVAGVDVVIDLLGDEEDVLFLLDDEEGDDEGDELLFPEDEGVGVVLLLEDEEDDDVLLLLDDELDEYGQIPPLCK